MTRENATPTCCCCHVKVGTFVLAVLILIGGIFYVIAASLPLANNETYEYYMSTMYDSENYSRSALWFVLGNGLLFIAIAFMTMYGVLKGRAAYLIPLFVVQLFDFMCTIIYIGSLMFYWPTVKLYILTCRHLPDEWKTWLLNLDDHWLAVMVFSVLFVYLFIRSYLISMVYRCYQFIKTQGVPRSPDDPEINCVSGKKSVNGPIYKPPKYEDILKVPLVDDVEPIDSKPPPYAS